MEIPSENTANQLTLFQLIASGDAILMVGAGSSKIVGYPLWGELITLLETPAKKIEVDAGRAFEGRGEKEDDLNYATRLKAILDRRYEALINEIFGADKGYNECHQKLLELPFRGILTTNYDRVLERALHKINDEPDNELIIDSSTANREINKFFQGLNFGYNDNKKIAHLHGHYKQSTSIVLCLEDYEKKYGSKDKKDEKWPLHKRILWALMATRRIVYVGFSMTDPFFQMMYDIVADDLGTFGSDSHFMITRFSSDNEEENAKQILFAERVKTLYGIQTVFFNDDKTYDGLKTYLLDLNIGVSSFLPEKEPIKPEPPKIIVGNIEVTEKFKEVARKRNQEIREGENQ